ncbi:SidA/IucD/PvdA family monooxygenase [Skermanella mucosa]|uniref:SidA/IucD/PvdA family monooxygenase n=1 Tax=Skermanella mucosa TaxID=1789672 RepID=UPI00192CBA23|nr:SidA/IucD/PvdA family monooxygenase [Skermanella mucosa]UEM21306.1 SidA/IucD/PvdA family monooxygenase [Skermanella mucosa]
MPHEIAVVGGGPKAAAIAAKAAVLKRDYPNSPNITIFEPAAIGSAWSGLNGYTDGEQLLCTLAERDVGFPYSRHTFGASTARRMASDFSWQSYCVSLGSGDYRYDTWVDKGRRPPIHKCYADYLSWVVRKSSASVVNGRVEHIQPYPAQGGWRVIVTDSNGLQPHPQLFSGIVITGSGPSLPALNGITSGQKHRVFDGKTFWQRPQDVINLLKLKNSSVAILGAGGTAAAIAAWFNRVGFRHVPITIVGRETTLYTRARGYFEDRMFSDDVAWTALPEHARQTFTERLTTGAVWEYVVDQLSSNKNILYKSAEIVEFVHYPQGGYNDLAVKLSDVPAPNAQSGSAVTTSTTLLNADVYVDARGFDAWWFFSLMPMSAPSPQIKRSILSGMDEALAIPPVVVGHENFHVPSLANIQGPAASNLMALGWMADRVLGRYLP